MAKFTALLSAMAEVQNRQYSNTFDDKKYGTVNIHLDLGQTYPRLGLPDNSYIPGIETAINTSDYNQLRSQTNYQEGPKKDMTRYLAAFGCPPVFSTEVDPRYPLVSPMRDHEYGRIYGKTILSNPSLLSLCPGSVKYLSSAMSEGGKNARQALYDAVMNVAGEGTPLADKISKDNGGALSGKLFTFTGEYQDYISIVNVLCRVCAYMLGFGTGKEKGVSQDQLDRSKSLWNPNKPYIYADYGYLTSTQTYKTNSNDLSPWAETQAAWYANVNSSDNDDTWVNFFITHQGTSLREEASVSVDESILEGAVGKGNELANNLAFLFGQDIGANMDNTSFNDDLAAILNVGDNGSFLGDVTKLLTNYLKGGKLVLPKMVGNFNYEKSLSCTLKLTAVYGDKEAIFTRCLVPIAHLIAMTIPKQIADNMYTFPFVCKAFQRGWFNSDLAVINNLSITRGGEDNTAWTVDGLATEYEVSFDIVPLVNNMMVTSSKNPFLFIKNEALIDYLGCVCGLDTRADVYKSELARYMIQNRLFDIPMNVGRTITQMLANAVTPFHRATDLKSIITRR